MKKDCPLANCPHKDDQVCGNDGKTYANNCGLLAAVCKNPGLKKEYDGPCSKKNPSKDSKGNAKQNNVYFLDQMFAVCLLPQVYVEGS